MSHELYIFGSIMRGEVSYSSDVDILVVPLAGQGRQNYPPTWSIYSAELITSYFQLGRLFAWHLYRESRCLFSPTSDNLIARLGEPAPYTSAKGDIDDLEAILNEALAEIRAGTNSVVYELGIIHTAIRDIAMSASWKLLGRPNFSRESPYCLPLMCPLPKEVYAATMLARHQSTRGLTVQIDLDAILTAVLAAPLSRWVDQLRSQL